MPRITGKVLAEDIKTTLESKCLELRNICGQGYDGASNMSAASGVQGRIKEFSPRAAYVHCNSHVLNLVIAKTCSLGEVRMMMDRLKSVSNFFLISPKRERLLAAIVEANVQTREKRKALIDMCRTRCMRRHEAYQHFFQSYVFIVEALEVIGHKMHFDRYETVRDMFGDWDPKSRSEAVSLVIAITGFPFIITFVTVYMFLSRLDGVTRQLQSFTLDILLTHENVITNHM